MKVNSISPAYAHKNNIRSRKSVSQPNFQSKFTSVSKKTNELASISLGVIALIGGAIALAIGCAHNIDKDLNDKTKYTDSQRDNEIDMWDRRFRND